MRPSIRHAADSSVNCTLDRRTNFDRRPDHRPNQLARQHRDHILGRELQQPHERNDASLRIVIAGEERALVIEQPQIVGKLSLQERHRVAAAHAQHTAVRERG